MFMAGHNKTRKKSVLAIVSTTAISVFVLAAAAKASISSVVLPHLHIVNGRSIAWSTWYESVLVDPWGTDSVRVRTSARGDTVVDDKNGDENYVSVNTSYIASAQNGATAYYLTNTTASSDDAPGALLQNGSLRVCARFDAYNGVMLLSFYRTTTNIDSQNPDASLCEASTDTELILEEHFPQHTLFPRYLEPLAHGSALFKGHVSFQSAPEERLYGLGQIPNGYLNQKGNVIDLEHFNSYTPIPFLLSSRRYGLIWNHAGSGRVELGNHRIRFAADSIRQLDYVVMVGNSHRDVLSRLADLTGHAQPMPHFATGFWQSKLRYASQEEVKRVVDEFRQRNIPLSVLVIDFLHWWHFGDWKFNSSAFPDPAAMVAHLDGIVPMVSVWPTVERLGACYEDMASRGFLTRNEFGTAMVGELEGYLYLMDPFHPQCRKYVFDRLKRGYLKYNISHFWLDCNEGNLGEGSVLQAGPTLTRPSVVFYRGSTKTVGLAYPFQQQRMVYEGLVREGRRGQDVFMLSRSAFLGSQRFGVCLHSGDTESSWEALRRQVLAGMNAQLSGIVWWTNDAGGFQGGDVDSPDFHELLVRWFEVNAFSPVFRTHGMRTCRDTRGFETCPNEPWSYSQLVLEAQSTLIWLREVLRPYIAEQMQIASSSGVPLQRPLWFDYETTDPETVSLEPHLFMFGDDMLIAPILHPQSDKRDVYLPGPETQWTFCWDVSFVRTGGSWVYNVSAPLGRPIIFYRTSPSLGLPRNPLIPPDLCDQAAIQVSGILRVKFEREIL